LAVVEPVTDVVNDEDELFDVEEDEVVELMEDDVLDVVEELVVDVIEDEVFDVDVVNDEDTDVNVVEEDVDVLDDEGDEDAEVEVDEDFDVDEEDDEVTVDEVFEVVTTDDEIADVVVDEDVVVKGTDVADVPVAIQLQALETLSEKSPAWLDGQALTANVGIAVAATDVAVKVAQRDCAAARRPGVCVALNALKQLSAPQSPNATAAKTSVVKA
jgi:hypothetical protein